MLLPSFNLAPVLAIEMASEAHPHPCCLFLARILEFPQLHPPEAGHVDGAHLRKNKGFYR
ncbi:hypothetical protein KSC_019940 [Ktedonobacter sp. SOSP1-52]|nr:hypothetical protein KSC_019940 [Ktedonobacter sp. SOSP1-52]